MECNVRLRSENILSVSVRVCVCVCPFFEKRSEISPARRKEAGRECVYSTLNSNTPHPLLFILILIH